MSTIPTNADKFARAIRQALETLLPETGGDMPAALGALISVQAYLIAGTPPDVQKSLIKTITETLPAQIARQVRSGDAPKVEIQFERVNSR